MKHLSHVNLLSHHPTILKIDRIMMMQDGIRTKDLKRISQPSTLPGGV